MLLQNTGVWAIIYNIMLDSLKLRVDVLQVPTEGLALKSFSQSHSFRHTAGSEAGRQGGREGERRGG